MCHFAKYASANDQKIKLVGKAPPRGAAGRRALAHAARLLDLAARPIFECWLVRLTYPRRRSPSARVADAAASPYLAAIAPRLATAARRTYRPRVAGLRSRSATGAERSTSLRPETAAATACSSTRISSKPMVATGMRHSSDPSRPRAAPRPRWGGPSRTCEMLSRARIRPPMWRSSGQLNFRCRTPKGAGAVCHLRSYWTSDCRISSIGHSLFALITRTCDPSDRLKRACEHVSSSIFLTSTSVVGSHCKVSTMSAGHMRHAELSLNSTI